jgi:hypothetical protein
MIDAFAKGVQSLEAFITILHFWASGERQEEPCLPVEDHWGMRAASLRRTSTYEVKGLEIGAVVTEAHRTVILDIGGGVFTG